MDGKLRLLKQLSPVIIALLVFVSVKMAATYPGFVEKIYSRGVYQFIAAGLSAVSGLFFFSLWDIFWVVFIITILSGIVLAIIKKIKWTILLLRIIQLLSVLYIIFYFSWGYNYFREPVEVRSGWKKTNAGEEVFRSILDSVILNTNKNYSHLSDSLFSKIDSCVEVSYKNNATTLGVVYPNGSRRAKTMIFSGVYAKFGVSGYFGPFFNEVHLNRNILPVEYPFLLAHEKAHQFGMATESEANLAAYIICATSVDMHLRYSGNMYMLLYFLKDASVFKDYRDYIKKIDSRVINDIRARSAYYNKIENETMGKMQTAANNVYLKSNNIKKGVINYNQVVSLVIQWYGIKEQLLNNRN
jgi:hypothetical protein